MAERKLKVIKSRAAARRGLRPLTPALAGRQGCEGPRRPPAVKAARFPCNEAASPPPASSPSLRSPSVVLAMLAGPPAARGSARGLDPAGGVGATPMSVRCCG